MVGQTRVHVDQVEGLGSFMELEVWNLKANFFWQLLKQYALHVPLTIQKKLTVKFIISSHFSYININKPDISGTDAGRSDCWTAAENSRGPDAETGGIQQGLDFCGLYGLTA